ncbi:corepressor interacting with RBPJ 1-like isoform X2 [Sinocyclocheilus grahami]|uniref:corepressor interacting with RBPJ 1-like isoform X2 n=1 Tax=Sinocyclocheilus grahami TaxID=75366 RepID=UPI0007AC6211|nr:PREDICTED: corepressor interacting with RBPJ 1-like isoform X2 [Sinocyclocheilus grahami]
MHPSELMAEMRNSGFALKKCVLGRDSTMSDPAQELVASEEDDPEVEFLKSLTTEKKQKLLRKFDRLEKKKKQKKKPVKSASSSSSSSDSISLRMRNMPERKPRRRAREGETRPVTAALRESARKTPNTHIQNTMSTEFRGHQTSTAERDGETTKREVEIDAGALGDREMRRRDTGAGGGGENGAGALGDREMRKREVRRDAGVGRGGENGAGVLGDGEMRKREVRRDTGARAGREETGAKNETRARG